MQREEKPEPMRMILSGHDSVFLLFFWLRLCRAAIGDIVGQPMLAHKAVHEAHVAAEVIAGELQGNKELAAAAFNARVIPSVAYTDPEVAWVGLTVSSKLRRF